MSPTRVRFARAAVAAPLLVIAACGGGDGDTAAAPDTTTSEPDAATATSDSTIDSSVVTSEPAVSSTSAAPAGPTSSASTTDTATADTGTATDTGSASASPDPTTAPVTSVPGGGWQDPTGSYAIAFPADPTEQQLTATTDDGQTVPVTAYLSEVDGAAVIVSCVPTPAGTQLDPDQSLTESQDRALEQMGAELVSSDPVELQGRPGLEYRGAIGEAGAVLGRTYVDPARVCNMLVVGEPAIVDVVAPPFLDSFEFLQEAA